MTSRESFCLSFFSSVEEELKAPRLFFYDIDRV